MNDAREVRWGLVHVALAPRRDDAEAYLRDVDALEEMAALLAAEPGISGVQTQDADTYDAAARPTLLVYTEADALTAAAESARLWAARLDLQVTVEAELQVGDAWLDAWKEHYLPTVYGASGSHPLLLRPSWVARRPEDPAAEIVLDPGRAFGTGLHATTRLCLQWLCEQNAVPGPLLDLGCGSGILGLAAARLFDVDVVAADVDPEATATTRENAELNGLTDRLRIVTGTLDAIEAPQSFATIVANIRPAVLIPAAPTLSARLNPGGIGLLSGILTEEASDILQAYDATEARPTLWRELEGWCAILLRRSTP